VTVSQITLRVDGQAWEGWEAASLDDVFGKSLCSRFQFTLSDRWRTDFAVRPIKSGMACEVWVDDELRLTGWIFGVNAGYGPNRHGIKITGRDLTADLVDCSSTIHLSAAATGKGKGGQGSKGGGGVVGAWTNRKLEDIARDLCAEFGVPFVAGDDTGAPIAQARLQLGETPFQILEKLCRQRNVWCASTVRGELTFLRASSAKLDGVLKRGVDILEADAEFDDSNRFSDYIGKGQQRGSDTIGPAQAAQVGATVSDPSITRHRPIIVQGEDQQNGETLADRVANEMHKKIGDSRSVPIGVAGWRMKDGTVWPTNRRVAIQDDWLGLDAEYLIERAAFRMDKSTHQTTLTLVPPEKYDIRYSGTKLQPALESTANDTSRLWDHVGPI
jgi:prophage tail gpP-like protein